jgi:hypothetical protein
MTDFINKDDTSVHSVHIGHAPYSTEVYENNLQRLYLH